MTRSARRSETLQRPSPHSSSPRITNVPANTNGTTVPRGLPAQVLKQLLTDLESHGGLNTGVSIKQICDLKSDIYGCPGSKIRKQVQNRVDRLRRIPYNDYLSLLQSLGVPVNLHQISTVSHVHSSSLHCTSASTQGYSSMSDSSPLRRGSSRQLMNNFDSPPPRGFRSPNPSSAAARRFAMNSQQHGEYDPGDVGKRRLFLCLM